MAPREYTLNYSPQLLRSAAIAFVWRFVDVWFLVLLASLGLFAAYRVSVGDHSWRVGAAGVAFLVVTIILIVLFAGNIRLARATARELSEGPVKFTISEQGLGFQSILGDAHMPWANISAAYEEKQFILIFFKRGGYTSVPLADLDSEAFAYIKKQVISGGGKVS